MNYGNILYHTANTKWCNVKIICCPARALLAVSDFKFRFLRRLDEPGTGEFTVNSGFAD